jgi:diguanylate cyclase (GGDEF)-like protein/PAS domain S-box-containing protein
MILKIKLFIMILLTFTLSTFFMLKVEAAHIEWDIEDIFIHHALVRMIIDVESQMIVFVSPSAVDFYGYTEEEMLSMKITEINTLTPAQIDSAMQKASLNEQNFFEFRHRLKNGEIRDVHVYTYPFVHEGRDYLYSTVIDVTARVREQRMLVVFQVVLGSTSIVLIAVLSIFMFYLNKDKNAFQYLANHDIMTGARSRLYFENVTKDHIVKRIPMDPFGFVMIDIDDFKHVNDIYGHVVGDQVLKYLVSELKVQMPESHSIYRYGGDEFILFIPLSEAITNLDVYMHDLIGILYANSPFDFDIKFSYGIVTIRSRNDLRDAIKMADLKMYKMKNNH